MNWQERALQFRRTRALEVWRKEPELTRDEIAERFGVSEAVVSAWKRDLTP